ncbi:hypothetical protein Tco_0983280, partial [Tanacetum coccineum]
SGRVSSGPNDVVVSLSAGEKGDGFDPSSAAGEDDAANPSGFRFSFSSLLFFVSPFSVKVGACDMPKNTCCSKLGETDSRCVVVHPADPESCHPP